MSDEFGWFHFSPRRSESGRPNFLGADLPPRRADDPPLVIWQQADDTWVVDDDDRDGYWHISGFTRDQIVAAVRFAWAMGWLDMDRVRPVPIRRVDQPDEQQNIE